MDFFQYRDGCLFCEETDVGALARSLGTPFYLYSRSTLVRHITLFQEAFAPISPLVCFSVKSLSNIHILKILVQNGAGIDVVSGGEIFKALQAGCPPEKIVFSGVGKTQQEIEYAIESGVGRFNVESRAECFFLEKISTQQGKKIHASLRINPDVYDTKTHDKTTTGKQGGKFGIDIDDALRVISEFKDSSALLIDGLHAHLGSPLYSSAPYVEAIRKFFNLSEEFKKLGVDIKSLNIGGGYKAEYDEAYEEGWEVFSKDIVPALLPFVKDRGGQVVMEPGRTISANAGILVTKVLYKKKSGTNHYLVVDAGMNDLVRPAMYDAYHAIWPVESSVRINRRLVEQTDFSPRTLVETCVAGPICESSDIFAMNRLMPKDIEEGDYLAIFSIGAYGSTMASNYNARPLLAEVLADGKSLTLIREKQSYEDLIRNERAIAIEA